MIGALFGVLGAAIIGTSDAIARLTGRKTPVLLLTTLLFLISLGPIGLFLLATEGWPSVDAEVWAVVALSGALNAVGLALLFNAIARGPVAVASPAASSFSIVLIGLNIFAGEPFRTGHAVGAALAFAAIFLLARPERGGRRGTEPAGQEDAAALGLTALIAIGAAFFIAFRMFTAQEAAESMSPLAVAVFSRAVAGLCAGAAYLAWRFSGGAFEPAPTPELRWHPPIWTLILLQSVLEVVALFLFLKGGEAAGGDRIAAVIGFTAFAAFSPIAARIIWAEKISPRRMVCIALTMAGVAAAALA